MNIAEAFVKILEDNNYGTLNTDIFIGGTPQEAPSTCFWLLSGGGAPITKNVTGEKQKNYVINLFYRNPDAKAVYDNLQAIEELLNSKGCLELEDHNALEIEATTLPTDNDTDSEDRTVGMIQATLTTYQNT